MKKVFTADNFVQLDQLRALLLSNGIDCMNKGETSIGSGAAGGEVPPVIIKNEIHVIEDSDVDRAQILIQEFLEAESNASDWNCPVCDELIEKQFTECWNCQEGDT